MPEFGENLRADKSAALVEGAGRGILGLLLLPRRQRLHGQQTAIGIPGDIFCGRNQAATDATAMKLTTHRHHEDLHGRRWMRLKRGETGDDAVHAAGKQRQPFDDVCAGRVGLGLVEPFRQLAHDGAAEITFARSEERDIDQGALTSSAA